jgi:hypothetical protein
VGRILLTWIPVYYDVPRMVQIVKPDGTHDSIPANQSYQRMPDGSPKVMQPGEDSNSSQVKLHDLINFRGTVTISSGPSYQTKRAEEVASILQLVQVFPQIMGVAGDLLVGAMDWHGAKQIAKRLKVMLPPGIGAAEEADQLAPENIAKLIQQHAQLTEAMQKLQHDIDTKTPELMTKRYIAEIQAEAGITEAQIKKGIADGQRQAAELEQITDLAHQAALKAQSDEQENRQMQQQHAHEAGVGAQDQEHAGAMAQMQHSHAGEMTQQQQAHDAQLARLQQQHDASLAAQQQGHEADQAVQQRQHDRTIAAMKPPAAPKAKARPKGK